MARATREDPPQDALHAARHRPSSAMRRPTTRSTTAIRTLSDRVATRSEIRAPTRLPGRAPSATAAVDGQHDVAAAVIEEGGGGGRDADHERAGRGRDADGDPAEGVQDRHLHDPAAQAEEPGDRARDQGRDDADGQAAHAVDVRRLALLQAPAQARPRRRSGRR